MTSARTQTTDEHPSVYGVILGYGQDRGGVLRDVLNVLLNGVNGAIMHRNEELNEELLRKADDELRAARKAGNATVVAEKTACAKLRRKRVSTVDAKGPLFNVTQCWVRSVGQIGVVMLRFTTQEVQFRKLSRWVQEINSGERSIEGDLILTDAVQPKPGEEPTPNHDSIRLRLHRTGRPWHLDASIRSGVLRYEGTRKNWEGEPDSQQDSGQELFEQLLHNLAADQELDVAQTDMVISEDNAPPLRGTKPKLPATGAAKALAHIRLFDLGARGKYLIERSVNAACAAMEGRDKIWKVEPNEVTHPGFSYHDDGDTDRTIEDNAQRYIQGALRGPVRETGSEAFVADIMVHALDVPGLLAEVYGFIKRQQYKIVRVCCRGLGSDAVVLLAVKIPRPPDPVNTGESWDRLRVLELEKLIRERIDYFVHKNAGKARFAEIARGMIHPRGYWRVFVQLSKSAIGANGTPQLEAFVQSKVGKIEDRPRLLLKLVRLLKTFEDLLKAEKLITTSARVNIFYMDVRPLRLKNGTFSEIGLGVSAPIENKLHDDKIQKLFYKWFDQAFKELKRLKF